MKKSVIFHVAYRILVDKDFVRKEIHKFSVYMDTFGVRLQDVQVIEYYR